MPPKADRAFAAGTRAGVTEIGSPSKTGPSDCAATTHPSTPTVKSRQRRKAKPSKATLPEASDQALASLRKQAADGKSAASPTSTGDQLLPALEARLDDNGNESSCSSDMELLPLHQRLQLRSQICQARPEPSAKDRQVLLCHIMLPDCAYLHYRGAHLEICANFLRVSRW